MDACAAVDQRVAQALAERGDIQVRQGLTGRDITTFAIGGPLRALAEVESIEGLQFLLRVLADAGIVARVIGNGSNLLVSDQGISDWLIRLGGAFRSSQIGESSEGELVRWTCGAGCSLMALSREVANLGLSGLGFAGGIPASIGGAVRMNAGAHGGEISQVLESITVLSSCGKIEERRPNELKFSYRHSSLREDELVLAARFVFRRTSIEEAVGERSHALEERRARQPLTVPSAGSIFKNPNVEQSAGYLIESAGLKGYRLGAVEISEKHANWIVNPTKQGLASDVKRLIQHCQEVVEKRFGLALSPEVIFFN